MDSGFDIVAVTKAGLRSAANTLPVLSAWVQLWNEHEAVELDRRVERFWQAFVLEAQHTDRRIEQINNDLQSTQESIAIVERAVRYARQDPSDGKQDRLATAAAHLVGAGTGVPYDTKASLIDTLDHLTDSDISILNLFAQNQTIKVERLPGSATQESLSVLIISLSKLESRGLIGETDAGAFGMDIEDGPRNFWFNRWRRKHYTIMPYGKQLHAACSPHPAG